jgi:hypothetical protein
VYWGPLSESHWIACGAVATVSPNRAQRALSMSVRMSPPFSGRGEADQAKTSRS